MKVHMTKKTGLVIFSVIVILLIAILPSYYFYRQYKTAQKFIQNPSEIAKEETKKLITTVGKLIDLPTDEEPTIATVSDIEKLKDQPFFAKAKMGDKVLIYTNAKKAILYDPVANKIIEVAPVNIGNATATGSATPQTTAPVRVVLYNGTDVTGLTRNAEKDLKDKVATVDVLLKDNAKKKDYNKTLVIDLIGNKKDEAEKIAKALSGEVTTLPLGEEKPASISGKTAEILVIIGKDYIK